MIGDNIGKDDETSKKELIMLERNYCKDLEKILKIQKYL